VSITETRPDWRAPTQIPEALAPKKRNVKKILGYVGVAVLGIAIGSSTAGTKPKPEIVEKIVTVDPTAERTAQLDSREQALAKRAGALDNQKTELDRRETAVDQKVAARKASTFEDGTFQVGADIMPGTYHTDGSGDSCYWEKSTGGTGVGSIIDNDNVSGPVTVVIEATTKFFKSSSCGTWTKR
jgi:hypothetical protein